MSSSSQRSRTDTSAVPAKSQPSASASFYAQAHAASADRAEAAEARVSAEAASISARLIEGSGGGSDCGEGTKLNERRRWRQRPPRCWPRSLLREIDAEARRRGRRCVMWDDSGPRGFCCWVRWDWERGVPLEMKGGEKVVGARGGGGGEEENEQKHHGDASWWQVLSRALGPPLVPSTGLEPSEVGAWLDRYTIKVHGWREEDLK